MPKPHSDIENHSIASEYSEFHLNSSNINQPHLCHLSPEIVCKQSLGPQLWPWWALWLFHKAGWRATLFHSWPAAHLCSMWKVQLVSSKRKFSPDFKVSKGVACFLNHPSESWLWISNLCANSHGWDRSNLSMSTNACKRSHHTLSSLWQPNHFEVKPELKAKDCQRQWHPIAKSYFTSESHRLNLHGTSSCESWGQGQTACGSWGHQLWIWKEILLWSLWGYWAKPSWYWESFRQRSSPLSPGTPLRQHQQPRLLGLTEHKLPATTKILVSARTSEGRRNTGRIFERKWME